MLSLDKQPHTCYVEAFPLNVAHARKHLHIQKWDNRSGDFDFYKNVKELKSVYLHTPEELAKTFREVAEKAWIEAKSLSNLYLYEYLDQHYPLLNQNHNHDTPAKD